MDLSEEFEEFLKKNAILKSSGAELQIANRSHLMAAVLAAVARYSADRQCYGAHISQLRLNCVCYHLWI